MDFYLERLANAIAGAIASLDAHTLLWHPEAKWNTAEILEHLYLTYTGTIRGFQRCLEAGNPLARTPSLRHRMRTFLVLGIGHMPKGRKAPKNALPRGISPELVLTDILAKISEMDAVIRQAEAKYGARTPVLDHPILGPLRAREWRKFHWVHGRHHLNQIRKLRRRAAQCPPQVADRSH